MTREQLDLMIEYINTKASLATKYAKGEGVSYHDTDRLDAIIVELEESTEN